MNFQRILERNQKLDDLLQSVEDGLPVKENYNGGHLMEMGNYKKKQIADYLYNRLEEARARISRLLQQKIEKIKTQDSIIIHRIVNK
jgi:uncharacterized protein YdcH (DUF465 family)